MRSEEAARTRRVEEKIGDADGVFEAHRPLLFSLAYRMLGSVADAEDIVQDAYLRWHQVSGGRITSPKRFLCAVVTRLCIDHLRSARVRREEYVGPWLPEPLVSELAEDPLDATVLAESLSMAFLLLLERLTPVERAVFLLREVLSFDYQEVARIVERSEAACRQIVKRSREKLAGGRRRFTVAPEEGERLARRFLEACAAGDMEGLLSLLAPDAMAWTDGGGKVLAARRPIRGRERVARFFIGVARKGGGWEAAITRVNGGPGLVLRSHGWAGELRVITFAMSDGRIDEIFVVGNPDKLLRVMDLGIAAGRNGGRNGDPRRLSGSPSGAV
jgi:RNA polymerase sigma-70 factor (ECF subfamily)